MNENMLRSQTNRNWAELKNILLYFYDNIEVINKNYVATNTITINRFTTIAVSFLPIVNKILNWIWTFSFNTCETIIQ